MKLKGNGMESLLRNLTITNLASILLTVYIVFQIFSEESCSINPMCVTKLSSLKVASVKTFFPCFITNQTKIVQTRRISGITLEERTVQK